VLANQVRWRRAAVRLRTPDTGNTAIVSHSNDQRR